MSTGGRRVGSCHEAWRQARSCTHADRHDQAAVLGDGDELGGVEQAALGVLPAHERLDAGDLAGAQADHRLVVEGELVAVERLAQLAFDLEPGHRLARISSSKSSQRARPLSLARYIAASASRISSSALALAARRRGDGDRRRSR